MIRSAFARLLFALVLLGIVPAASAQSDYTKTRHPIVLVHGLLGFDSLFGVYDYWYGVPSDLRSGGAKVFVANVSSSNYTEVRGEQLIRDLLNLRAVYGYQKFNLIGHSHGGPTARYVASVRPDLVASVTSVGSPHTGSKVADALATSLPEGSPLRPLVAGFVDALSGLIEFLSGDDDPQYALGALASLSSSGSELASAAAAPSSSRASSVACSSSVSRSIAAMRAFSRVPRAKPSLPGTRNTSGSVCARTRPSLITAASSSPTPCCCSQRSVHQRSMSRWKSP